MPKQEGATGDVESVVSGKMVSTKNGRPSDNRRTFLNKLAGAAALAVTTSAIEMAPLAKPVRGQDRQSEGRERTRAAFEIRERAAKREWEVTIPDQVTNGDERRYPNFIGNYSKGLPHTAMGEVDEAAYQQLLKASHEGTVEAFESIPLGGNVKLANPMAGIAFDLEGTDSHQLAIGPPPTVASRARADDMVELYWMALCRDVSFTEYVTDPTTVAAQFELSGFGESVSPKTSGQVTAQTLFRGFTADDLVGPYVSQLLLRPFNYGQYTMSGQISTYIAGIDYLTDQSAWLNARNGQGPFAKNQVDPQPRFIRNGRDLAAYVHTDQAFEAFYNAGVWLGAIGAPPNPANPYLGLTKQSSFVTFGAPHFLCLLAEAASCALKAVWYAKWFVHRTLRPEDYGGLVHMTMTHQTKHPLHADVLDSRAAGQTFSKYGSYFHPQAYPEGCPQHPSYAQGHGAIAGACATILKAAFNGTTAFHALSNGAIQTASQDGLSLVAYTEMDAGQITVNGEINKLLARNFAGVHWRTDYSDGLKLGEAVALSILSDQRECYAEEFSGFQITKFDGTVITT